MYPSIPYVEPDIQEPQSISEMEETGISQLYIFVPLTDIMSWEPHGYHRAHTVDNCTNKAGLANCCMYHKELWEEWYQANAR